MAHISKKKKIFLIVFGILLLLLVACGIYVSDYYHADEDAITAFSPVTSNSVEIEEGDNDIIVYTPDEAKAGFIFYPGGKVEYTAYEPLMKELASEGILCVLVKMPFNLAILDTGAADGITELHPDVKDWYIGGHSLGGSAASMYLEKNHDDFAGLILLGSYSTCDLKNLDIKVLSIYGSEDKVMNYDSYTENIVNLPKDYKEVVIEGGCHAYFGMYGSQEGDGTPTISNEEQIHIVAKEINKFLD